MNAVLFFLDQKNLITFLFLLYLDFYSSMILFNHFTIDSFTWNKLYLATISMCPQTSGRVNVTWRARSLFRPQIDNTWVRLLDMLYLNANGLHVMCLCASASMRIISISYFFDFKPCKIWKLNAHASNRRKWGFSDIIQWKRSQQQVLQENNINDSSN